MRKSKNGLACLLAFALTMGMPALTRADIEMVSPGIAVSGTTSTITDDLPASETAVEPTVDSASESEAEESILGMDPEVNMYPVSDLNESMDPAQEEDFPNVPDEMNSAQLEPLTAVSGTTSTITDDLPASETAVEPTVDSASESEAEESILGMDPEVNMYPVSDLNESMDPAQEEDFPNVPDDMNSTQLEPLTIDEDVPEGEIIVTIPPTINFSRERTEHCNLSISVRGLDSYSDGGIAVEVFVASQNGFILSDGKQDIEYGVYSSGSTVPLTNGCQAARFTSDGSQDLTISIIEETPQYGRYTDTLTFTLKTVGSGTEHE